jgi:hypothetical protein
MDKPHILHLFTPAAQASPFDVNMAYDAGFQAVVPYTGMRIPDVTTLTQDAIFSRGPKGVKRTGIFIGGRDLALALEMLDTAKRAMVPPFEVSVFVDPSGAFTTAAAAVAVVERRLKTAFNTALAGKSVLVLGGTGPVGTASAILAAQEECRGQGCGAGPSGLGAWQGACADGGGRRERGPARRYRRSRRDGRRRAADSRIGEGTRHRRARHRQREVSGRAEHVRANACRRESAVSGFSARLRDRARGCIQPEQIDVSRPERSTSSMRPVPRVRVASIDV